MVKPFLVTVFALAAVTALFSAVLFYLAQTSEEVYVMIHSFFAVVCLYFSFCFAFLGAIGLRIFKNSR